MLKIKLPTKLERTTHITYFPDYISNGYWAVKKSSLVNAPIFSSLQTTQAYWPKYEIGEKDSNNLIQQINDCIKDPHKLVATRYVETRGKEEFRFFTDTVTNELTQFNRDYLALFGLDQEGAELWGSIGNACRDAYQAADITFLIMPVTFDEKQLTVLRRA